MGRRRDKQAAAAAAGAAGAADDSVWAKALKRDGGWDKESFEEFPTAVHWVRQVVGLLLGLAWGVLGLTGLPALLGFGVANAGLTFLYYAKYAGADVEDFGSTELLKEGFMPSFGLFVLTWTVTYSALYHPGV